MLCFPHSARKTMIGIIVPAHNEVDSIVACVKSVLMAAKNVQLQGEPVQLVVVTDACTDATATKAAQAGAAVLSIDARNVGAARAAAAELMMAQGARWPAFTDADTWVSPDWIADQLALGADAVCGTVGMEDFAPHGEHADLLRRHLARTYFDVEAHGHIHGANLGVTSAAYRRAGGFPSLACSEDVALVRALEATGAHIAWSARPRVVTSTRRNARAVGGFADALVKDVAQQLRANPTRAVSI